MMYAFQDAEWHTLAYDTSDLDMEAKVCTIFQALLTLPHSVSNFCYYPQSQVAYLTKDTTKFDVHLMLRWNADGGVDGDL